MDDMRERFLDLMEDDQTDPNVQYDLGRCYLDGRGVEKNGREAEKWLRRAAEQGHAKAKALLNSARTAAPAVKTVTKQNLPEWCQRAEDGDPEAQYQVAVYFRKASGSGAKEDVRRYLAQAAEQGHPKACLVLGKDLLKTDPVQAVQQLRNAADCGLAEASELLGMCYMQGNGVEQNPEEAERRFCKAAEQGNGEARLRMAMRYVKGDGVEQSRVKALSWVKRAEDAGVSNARERFERSCADWQAEQAKKRKEEKQRQAAARRAEEQRQAAARRAEEQRKAERQRRAEEQRQAAARRAEEKRRTEEKRRAEEQRRTEELIQQARLATEAAAQKREVWEGPLLVVVTWLAAGMPLGWLLTLTRWSLTRQVLGRIFFPFFLWSMRWLHPNLLLLLWVALYRVGRWRMDKLRERMNRPTSTLMRFFWEYGLRIYKWAGWGGVVAACVVSFFTEAGKGGILRIFTGIFTAGVCGAVVWGLLFYRRKVKK